MLAKLTEWMLFCSIATSGLIDQTIFPPLGIKYLTLPRIFIAGYIVTIWIRLLKNKNIVPVFRSIIHDKASKVLFWSISGLMLWQTIANRFSFYPLDGLLNQLQWIEIAIILITSLFVIKADYFHNIRISWIIITIILSQTINILFAFSQCLETIIKKEYLWDIHISGTTWYPQSFGVFSAMVLPILWSTFDLIKAQCKIQKIFIFLLIMTTCLLLPFSGSRNGMLCFAVAFILWPFLSPRTTRISVMGMSLAMVLAGILLVTPTTTTDNKARSIKINIPSTHARIQLLLTDISLLSTNPIIGIGMGVQNYKKNALRTENFKTFAQIDPFVANKPFSHSGTTGVAVSSGLPGFFFFVMVMLGIVVILWRSSVWSLEPALNKSFLCSFLVFQCGYFFHPLYGEWPWFIFVAGILLAHKSMPKQTAVFTLLPMLKATLTEVFSAVLNIIWRCKKFTKRKNKSANVDIKLITVLGLIGLGDWLVVLPGLDALRKKYPGADITILTNRLGDQTLQLSSVKTKPVILPDFPRGITKFFRINSWLNKYRQELDADLLVSLWWHPTHQFLACLMPFKFFYGFFTCGGTSTSQMHNRIYYLESNISQTKMIYREYEWFGNMRRILLSGLGVNTIENLFICNDMMWKREELCSPESLLVVCQPHCFLEGNAWDIRKWENTLLGIHKKTKAVFILIGGNDDRNICEKLYKDIAKEEVNVINLCGKTSIPQLAGILKIADLFLGTDSGPGHLASALGTKSIIIYGPTKPENYIPIGFKGISIYRKIDCSPCGTRYCLLSKENRYMCMKQINPDEVAESALKLLS